MAATAVGTESVIAQNPDLLIKIIVYMCAKFSAFISSQNAQYDARIVSQPQHWVNLETCPLLAHLAITMYTLQSTMLEIHSLEV